MKPPTESSSASFTTKVSPQELGHIITLRKNLDLMGVLGRFAEQYLKLGWSLAALDAQTGDDLGLDFTLPREAWFQGLMDTSLKGTEVNLAVRTGSASRLFAVRIDTAASLPSLDSCGAWRSPCTARNNAWEQHFYRLPPTWNLPASAAAGINILGEGALALVPPSLEPDSEDAWRWLQAPWESPPCPPPPGLVGFMEKSGLLAGGEAEQKPVLGREEVFARISGHKELLGVWLTPQASCSRYYQKILTAALKAGFREPGLLQALLWHAPHGDVRQRPESWGGLLKVVAEVVRAAPARPAAPAPKLKRPAADSNPHQTLLDQLERLTVRTLELEKQLAALQQTSKGADAPLERRASRAAAGRPAAPLREEWLALIQRPSLGDREVRSFETAVANFMKANPDLAGNEGKLQMVLYCYANYINIDPANDGLPYAEKLARAGEMARSMLNSPAYLK